MGQVLHGSARTRRQSVERYFHALLLSTCSRWETAMSQIEFLATVAKTEFSLFKSFTANSERLSSVLRSV